jgi:hypothetical protein
MERSEPAIYLQVQVIGRMGVIRQENLPALDKRFSAVFRKTISRADPNRALHHGAVTGIRSLASDG